ncbi:MAG: KH domain-containing protein [Eubacteriales bacterium]|nr:KH domain-containing protein [Eubacteriales bacterium]MDD3197326.1 KH domain-containing protein [Eubacteriales bacterium]
MKELLSTIVRPLVSDPDSISINQIDQGYTVVLELKVAPEDMGKVIGRQGRRAQAIRSIMKARAALTGKRVIVDIVG